MDHNHQPIWTIQVVFFVSEKNIEPDDGKHLKFGMFAISILAIFKGVHQPFVFGGWVTGLARFMSPVQTSLQNILSPLFKKNHRLKRDIKKRKPCETEVAKPPKILKRKTAKQVWVNLYLPNNKPWKSTTISKKGGSFCMVIDLHHKKMLLCKPTPPKNGGWTSRANACVLQQGLDCHRNFAPGIAQCHLSSSSECHKSAAWVVFLDKLLVKKTFFSGSFRYTNLYIHKRSYELCFFLVCGPYKLVEHAYAVAMQ